MSICRNYIKWQDFTSTRQNYIKQHYLYLRSVGHAASTPLRLCSSLHFLLPFRAAACTCRNLGLPAPTPVLSFCRGAAFSLTQPPGRAGGGSGPLTCCTPAASAYMSTTSSTGTWMFLPLKSRGAARGGHRKAALKACGAARDGQGRAGLDRAAVPYRSAGPPAPAGRSGSAPASPAASSPGRFGAGPPASSGLVPPSPPPPPPPRQGRRWPWRPRCPPRRPLRLSSPRLTPSAAGTRSGRRGPVPQPLTAPPGRSEPPSPPPLPPAPGRGRGRAWNPPLSQPPHPPPLGGARGARARLRRLTA